MTLKSKKYTESLISYDECGIGRDYIKKFILIVLVNCSTKKTMSLYNTIWKKKVFLIKFKVIWYNNIKLKFKRYELKLIIVIIKRKLNRVRRIYKIN